MKIFGTFLRKNEMNKKKKQDKKFHPSNIRTTEDFFWDFSCQMVPNN